MSIKEFNQLESRNKIATLTNRGVKLRAIANNECMRSVYGLEDFFVEIMWDFSKPIPIKIKTIKALTNLEDINRLN